VTIRLSKLNESANQALARPKPVKAGVQAPEWNVSGWTDGKERKLSDLRGQVVFVDFWGLWCGPCMQAVPAVKELHDKFKTQVVFIGIHTAGTDISQVRKVLDLKDWHVPVGLDAGPQITKGETVHRFGVRGFPTWVIVDRQGRIAFNSIADDSIGDEGKVMAKMKALAEEMKLPWPIDKDATDDEVETRLHRMQVYMLSKEIEKALTTK
jgi:thiol-disulfide isomerase/thioredoxin